LAGSYLASPIILF